MVKLPEAELAKVELEKRLAAWASYQYFPPIIKSWLVERFATPEDFLSHLHSKNIILNPNNLVQLKNIGIHTNLRGAIMLTVYFASQVHEPVRETFGKSIEDILGVIIEDIFDKEEFRHPSRGGITFRETARVLKKRTGITFHIGEETTTPKKRNPGGEQVLPAFESRGCKALGELATKDMVQLHGTLEKRIREMVPVSDLQRILAGDIRQHSRTFAGGGRATHPAFVALHFLLNAHCDFGKTAKSKIKIGFKEFLEALDEYWARKDAAKAQPGPPEKSPASHSLPARRADGP